MSVIAIGNQLPRDTLAGSAMLARSRSGVEVPGNAAKPQADYSHRGENRLMAVVFQHPITITDFGHVSPNNFGTGWRRDIKERTRWITRQRWPDERKKERISSPEANPLSLERLPVRITNRRVVPYQKR
jgi:hypothetical protein